MGAVTPSDLQNWQLVSYLPAADLARLARIASQQIYRKGERIFSEGDKAEAFYALLRGQVKVFKVGPDGREQILRVVYEGEQFAEAAALSGGVFPANAETTARSVIARVPTEEFRELLESNPQLALNMILALSQLLRNFAALVDALALREVPARLAKYLLDLSARTPGNVITLDIRKGVLAARLGTVSETLSRSLRRLRDRKIIQVEGDNIKILNRNALERVAAGLMSS